MFFYGLPMTPKMLKSLLNLPTRPTLRRATLADYANKLWGPYPVLVPKPGGKAQGMVWYATPDQFESLEYYEGSTYTWTECEVEVEEENVDAKEEQGMEKWETVRGRRVFVAKDPESEGLEGGVWEFGRA
ncbi:hypothetical protein K458DRAFT_489595 [Lentithecium fluviatile CBS 122367]|uniref:Putative gamma-glutamylcyclotransferase n=1 Tax=Lentithecium fluviatile CBS 122367 TaxID=1168545 RepID=A0A6G1ISH7_9PLEO|nr:hypothetical protein K458DRAFT_489595 [Lentithecium fluviatile CBS 122367]